MTFHAGSDKPMEIGSGVWTYQKVDNRGEGKKVSGEKVKATTLEMFEHQCKTVAASYNMNKAKYEAKKR